MKLIMETRPFEEGLTDDQIAEKYDWGVYKEIKYSNINIKSLLKQAKKLLSTGKYSQIHICGWEDENDDPSFQEFHYKDGSKFKMF